MSPTVAAIVIVVALAGAAPARAAAGAATDLADTCARALAHGYSGLEAEACNWYVAPCPACGGAAPRPPAWCAPPQTANAIVAAAFVRGLRQQPAAAGRSAHDAVDEVLARPYPCH